MKPTDIWGYNRKKEGRKEKKKKGRERKRQRERESKRKEGGGKEGGEREGRPALQSAHLKPLGPSHQWKMNSLTLVTPL